MQELFDSTQLATLENALALAKATQLNDYLGSYSKYFEKIKPPYFILPWDLPTVPGISQKIPPHTSKIKQTWLNQIHSINEIWLYSAMLSSNGFLFSSIIMVLNYYFAQHLKKFCTYTKAMGGEKLDYRSILGIDPGLSKHQCISSNATYL